MHNSASHCRLHFATHSIQIKLTALHSRLHYTAGCTTPPLHHTAGCTTQPAGCPTDPDEVGVVDGDALHKGRDALLEAVDGLGAAGREARAQRLQGVPHQLQVVAAAALQETGSVTMETQPQLFCTGIQPPSVLCAGIQTSVSREHTSALQWCTQSNKHFQRRDFMHNVSRNVNVDVHVERCFVIRKRNDNCTIRRW